MTVLEVLTVLSEHFNKRVQDMIGENPNVGEGDIRAADAFCEAMRLCDTLQLILREAKRSNGNIGVAADDD